MMSMVDWKAFPQHPVRARIVRQRAMGAGRVRTSSK